MAFVNYLKNYTLFYSFHNMMNCFRVMNFIFKTPKREGIWRGKIK